MMKQFIYVFFTAAAFLSWSCGGSADSSTEAADTAEEPTAESSTTEPAGQTVAASGENYEIVVLDASQASPRKEMKGKVGDVEISINYSSPSVKGRQIWGGLEAYDEVWRTGANEATRITFSQDVMINGEKLAAGTYGLFSIPSETEWTVIFNQDAEQWGSNNYDEGKDALRVKTTHATSEEVTEQLDFSVEGDQVVLRWEKVAVSFTVAGA